MGLIFAYAYQHHDANLINPVIEILGKRGHNLMSGTERYYTFLNTYGPRALLLVADLYTEGHIEGRFAVNLARRAGIKSLSIQHGCPAAFPDKGEPPTRTAADFYCLWGDFWQAHFESPAQIVTGNPSLPPLQEYEKERVALLCPAFRPDAKHSSLRGMDTQERAEFYVKFAKGLKYDGNWIIRPHPSDWKFADRMAAYDWMVDELRASLSREPLPDDLKKSELVAGTSTVLIEALVYGCEIKPVFMEYLPEIYDEQLINFDGRAAERIANEVEKCLYAW